MARYTNSIVEVSSLGDFETQIEKLFRQLRAQAVNSPNTTDTTFEPPTPKQDYQYSSILVDYGNGRITSGFKSLELLSILCSGTLISNLFLFDNTIYTGSAAQFQTASDDTLTLLVLDNLGMTAIIDGLDSELTSTYRNTCLNIGKLVKVGAYTRDTYASYILTESKRLLKIYLRQEL